MAGFDEADDVEELGEYDRRNDSDRDRGESPRDCKPDQFRR